MTLIEKHKGARSELLASVWLLEQGYEVFRNVSAFGDVDIVGIKDGKIELFDVKTATKNPEGRILRNKFSQKQKELGVKCICVFTDGSCEFDEHESFRGDVVSRECECCGNTFIVGRWFSRQKFCSSPCGTKASKKRREAAGSDSQLSLPEGP